MIIDHPLLGPRDAPNSSISAMPRLIDRPDRQAEDAAEAFYEYVYLRDNPAGEHRELWYHEQGDRPGWSSRATPLTHEITGVELARDVARGAGARRNEPGQPASTAA